MFIDKNVTSSTSNKDVVLARLEQDYDIKLAREKKVLEDKVGDLEKQIEDIKVFRN